jgi:hypothetical protein
MIRRFEPIFSNVGKAEKKEIPMYPKIKTYFLAKVNNFLLIVKYFY